MGGRHFQLRVLYFWGILKSEADSFSLERFILRVFWKVRQTLSIKVLFLGYFEKWGRHLQLSILFLKCFEMEERHFQPREFYFWRVGRYFQLRVFYFSNVLKRKADAFNLVSYFGVFWKLRQTLSAKSSIFGQFWKGRQTHSAENVHFLTLILLNPDMSCLCKQCRSRSVGFWRSQLIWICTICQ